MNYDLLRMIMMISLFTQKIGLYHPLWIQLWLWYMNHHEFMHKKVLIHACKTTLQIIKGMYKNPHYLMHAYRLEQYIN